ncbi:MAG: Cellulose 1,4-beta-cellobiosidase [Bacteroidetes bacterium]|nr:Cellulose 1,4-beta-cellobiosidase [Bacteroidota bacterium]
MKENIKKRICRLAPSLVGRAGGEVRRGRLLCLLLLCFPVGISAQQWIRVNQLGYLSGDRKVAVWLSKQKTPVSEFKVVNELTGEVAFRGRTIENKEANSAFGAACRLNFSAFAKAGSYRVEAGNAASPVFRIGDDVYRGAADVPLNYMRQQRCGYNPFLKDSCHRYDGRIIFLPGHENEKITAWGGWHDASDYLKYVTTSANATFQMLFAYQQNPAAFGDQYDANGLLGSNGIPDVLDEAKWGLDWLVRLNPDKDTFFNQIADDRDHASFRLPTTDPVDYGWGSGKERPVYACMGEPQGLRKYKNRSTGLASTVGKYASSFALASEVLAKFYPDFAEKLKQKAADAYQKGVEHPGACQTASCVSPYFYEEDNWVDDMELAATQLYRMTGKEDYLKSAVNYGRMEPVTPWLGADSARHYQWYPFINLGHYFLGEQNNKRISAEFIRNMRSGLERLRDRAGDDPFINGIPFIWCSNNLVVAAATQARLYRILTGDTTFLDMETALRDWLFGCNPWGKCMIVGLPGYGDYPHHPHSALAQLYHYPITGGLVDGPIYTPIFASLKGVHLTSDDLYADFQSDRVVYHDDYADYSSNEPTMDGTASLCYYLSSLAGKLTDSRLKLDEGGIVRRNGEKKEITLVFTGHEFADGAEIIAKVLKKHDASGAFFLTGDFYRKYPKIVRTLQQNGNYLGPHSDKHLLYADWSKRDSTLVSREQFDKDLKDNYAAMRQAGLKVPEQLLFLPAFEYYNKEIAGWTAQLGVTLVNYTPGSTSNADYTTPDMKSYRSSDEILNNILKYESSKGLNGFLLLTHIGTDPRRTDKFYNKLDELMTTLEKRGYRFVSITELLK